MKTIVAVTALGAALLSTPAFAQHKPVAAQRSPLTLDAAGVKLGMSMEQARAAAVASSYRCEAEGKETTFVEQVAAEVLKRREQSDPFRVGTGVRKLECRGPNGEYLEIAFAHVRSGAIVDEYRLQIAGATINLPAVRRQLSAKYGKPTVGNDTLGSWCDAGYQCGSGVVFSDGPIVVIDAMTRVDIMATRGKRARDADQAAVAAAADAVAPKKSRAAF